MKTLESRLQELGIDAQKAIDDIYTELVHKDNEVSRKLAVVQNREREKELRCELEELDAVLELVKQQRNEKRKADREKVIAESGLVEAAEEDCEEENVEGSAGDSMHDLYMQYATARRRREMGDNVKIMQEIYKKVSLAAEAGDAEALYTLAEIEQLGMGGSRSSDKTYRISKMAADKGHAKASYKVHELVTKGQVSYEDRPITSSYLKCAAAGNQKEAKLEYAHSCSDAGMYMSRDEKTALKYYEELLDQEVSWLKTMKEYQKTLYNYARLWWRHNQSQNNLPQLEKLLKELREEQSQYNQEAEDLYVEALIDCEKKKEAVSYYLKMNNERGIIGITKIFYRLGQEYQDKLENKLKELLHDKTVSFDYKDDITRHMGLLFEKHGDEKRAFYYFAEYCVLNRTDAKNKRRIIDKYINSSNMDAFLFFKECAEMGNCEAYKYLGDKYAKGQGCNRDYRKAAECYVIARESIFGSSVNRLIDEMRKMEELKRMYDLAADALGSDVYEQGVAKLESLAQKRLPEANYKLGELYEKGYRVAQNAEKAFKYYTEAASLDNRDAWRKMEQIYREGLLGKTKDLGKASYYAQKLRG